MSQVRDKEEIVRRRQEIYETRLRTLQEERNRGKFLVINTETGDYDTDASDMAAYRLSGRVRAL